MKISIIGGAGKVGSHVGYALLLRDIKMDELVLQDVVESVIGEAMDLQQAAAAMGKDVKIRGTLDIAECKDSDIVIIAAGKGRSSDEDRYSLLEANKKILDSILEKNPGSEKTIYLITTNPVDAMTYFLVKSIGDRKRVIGISTITDTGRMKVFSDGYLIGEHGKNMVPIGEDVVEKVKESNIEVLKLKGGTWFLTPVGITKIVKSIVNDGKKEFPVSVLLEGEYGFEDVCLSVPCIIGRNGVEEIKELKLDEKQKEILEKAVKSIKSAINKVEQ